MCRKVAREGSAMVAERSRGFEVKGLGFRV
jgi:hypothetical protein